MILLPASRTDRVGLLKGEHHTSGDLVGIVLFLETRRRRRYPFFLLDNKARAWLSIHKEVRKLFK